ncbi:MAG: hypothetical protein JNL58_27215 [Planctomyces sp.]|nr:hypothetical protein [Planctomyces sp.]
MLESFVTLFAAYLSGDFLLRMWLPQIQSFLGKVGDPAKSGKRVIELLIRPGILVLFSGVLLGSMNPAVLLIAFVAYFLVRVPTALEHGVNGRPAAGFEQTPEDQSSFRLVQVPEMISASAETAVTLPVDATLLIAVPQTFSHDAPARTPRSYFFAFTPRLGPERQN